MNVDCIFRNVDAINKVGMKLPMLFAIAEAESKRGGRTGMEVGVTRERILVSMLRHYFGRDSVETDIPTTEPEADAVVSEQRVSIKTVTQQGIQFSGANVKIVWTVDSESLDAFVRSYSPSADILLSCIAWGHRNRGLFHIPLSAQLQVQAELGNDRYIKRHRPGTNPRGAEYSKAAMLGLVDHRDTSSMEIQWIRPTETIDIYERWDSYWNA